MRITTFALAAALVLVPALAEAQNSKGRNRRPTHVVQIRRGNDCCWGNRFTLEPYAGAIKDAYDASPDGEDTGYLVGFRVGYALSNRTRLLGNVAYSETDNVSNPGGLPDYFMYDNNWVFTTAGAEFDVVPGRTSASLGLQGGVAWRKTDVDGSVGSPIGAPETGDGFASYAVLIPGLMLRHRFSSRWAAMVGLQDNIFDFLEGPAQHSLALTAGIAFR
jgi:hypothetical protein